MLSIIKLFSLFLFISFSLSSFSNQMGDNFNEFEPKPLIIDIEFKAIYPSIQDLAKDPKDLKYWQTRALVDFITKIYFKGSKTLTENPEQTKKILSIYKGEALFVYLLAIQPTTNSEKAFDLLSNSLKQGLDIALSPLAELYKKKGDIDKAIILHTQSATKGFYDSYHLLADIYKEKGDINKAKENYKLAIQKGYYFFAQDSLKELGGDLKKFPSFSEDSKKKASQFFDKASKEELKGNLKKAQKWYLKAAQHGDPIAGIKLEVIYKELEIKNYIMSWHTIRAGQEDVLSQIALGEIYESLGDYEQAFEWLNKSVYKSKDSFALLTLAIIESKRGNRDKAKKLYELLNKRLFYTDLSKTDNQKKERAVYQVIQQHLFISATNFLEDFSAEMEFYKNELEENEILNQMQDEELKELTIEVDREKKLKTEASEKSESLKNEKTRKSESLKSKKAKNEKTTRDCKKPFTKPK